MKTVRALVALGCAALAAAIAGCGGSGSGGAAAGQADRSKPFSVGGLTGRVAGTVQPPVAYGSGSTQVTGLAGGTITSLNLLPDYSGPDAFRRVLANTRLAYALHSGLTDFPYTVACDGTDNKPLTTQYSGFVEPCWSPDGSQVCFTGAPGKLQLYVVNADGTGIRRISDGTTNDLAPAWSRDGTRIAFMQQTLLATMNPDGTGRSVTNLTVSWPTWTSNGEIIYADPQGLVMVHPDGTNGVRIYTVSSDSQVGLPRVSPNGQRIAFTRSGPTQNYLVTMNSDGSNIHESSPLGTYCINGDWSPDGSHIALMDRQLGTAELAYVSADGVTATEVLTGDMAEAPAWQPLPSRTLVAGTNAMFGSIASGFVTASRVGAVRSVVVFGATTPDSASISPPALASGTDDATAVTIQADHLASLAYSNGLAGRSPTVVATGTATGAVVWFTTADGFVSSILLFTANRSPATLTPVRSGSAVTYRAAFTGIYDSHGHNLAPRGAHEVTLDARTGAVRNFR